MSSALEKQVGGSHYKKGGIQPIEYIKANNLGFIEGSVIKYVTRHKDKNGREDIEKAIHYLELLLEQDYPKKVQAPLLYNAFEQYKGYKLKPGEWT